MNRRSFLARFVGGLAAISLRLEELPKSKVSNHVDNYIIESTPIGDDTLYHTWKNVYSMASNRWGKTEATRLLGEHPMFEGFEESGPL